MRAQLRLASPARPSSLPPVLCFLLLCPGFLWGAPLPHPISPHPFSNLFFSGLTWECCSRGHPPAPGCRKPAPQPLLQHDPSPGLWGPPFPCLLPSPPTAAAPSLSSFPLPASRATFLPVNASHPICPPLHLTELSPATHSA